MIFQSSRSLRTATQEPELPLICKDISILAVLADRDHSHGAAGIALSISILAVLADRDALTPERYAPPAFQSSRSLRTATADANGPWDYNQNFNPRGPCGPRLFVKLLNLEGKTFQSSRSLRTATRILPRLILRRLPFQSSRSLRTATWLLVRCRVSSEFQSSRSLRTATPPRGGPLMRAEGLNFNPRGPCGPRRDERQET